jgi:hypothetical protein
MNYFPRGPSLGAEMPIRDPLSRSTEKLYFGLRRLIKPARTSTLTIMCRARSARRRRILERSQLGHGPGLENEWVPDRPRFHWHWLLLNQIQSRVIERLPSCHADPWPVHGTLFYLGVAGRYMVHNGIQEQKIHFSSKDSFRISRNLVLEGVRDSRKQL